MATPSFKFLRQNRTTAAVATAAGLAYFLYNITRAEPERAGAPPPGRAGARFPGGRWLRASSRVELVGDVDVVAS